MRGAWRSMEASTAPIAKRCSMCGGSTFAAVGKNPSMAKPRPPRTSTRSVTITPRANFPMDPPDGYCGRWAGSGASCGRRLKRARRPFSHISCVSNSIRFQLARLADHIFNLGEVVQFLRWGKRDRGIQASNANDGAVEIVKRFFVDDGCDFACEAAGARVLVKEDDFVGLLHSLRDGFAVERGDRAQVEDFEIDSVLGQKVGGFERSMDHRGVGDEAEVVTFAREVRFADGDDVILGGNFALDAAIKIFVLEEDAGIVIPNGGFDQAFGVVGRGRANDFETGIVDEPHFGILRVERAAVDVSAARAAQNERRGCAPQVMRFCDHVADLVEGAADEIHELEFGDGAHTGERCSEGRAYDGGLGDGRVDDALRAEAVDETVGDLKSSAINSDVFAETDNGGVAVHFFPDSLADGFEVGEEHS